MAGFLRNLFGAAANKLKGNQGMVFPVNTQSAEIRKYTQPNMSYNTQPNMSSNLPGMSSNLFQSAGAPMSSAYGAYGQANFNPLGALGSSSAPRPSGGVARTPQVASATTGFGDPNALAAGARSTAQSSYDKNSAYLKGIYRDAEGDITKNLDFQLSNLPGQQALLESNIEDQIGAGRADIESQRSGLLSGLAGQTEGVQQQGKSSMRELAENQRQTMQATGQYIGNLGGGDSSAVGAASNAIGRQGLKQQGRILEQQSQALQVIESKKFDVDRISNDALNKLESDKRQKLNELAVWASQTMGELQNSKANATSQGKMQLAQAEMGLRENLTNRLFQIDDEVRSQANSVSMWQQQRQAEMEDYRTKLASAGTNSGYGNDIKRLQSAAALQATLSKLYDAAPATNVANQAYGTQLPTEGFRPPKEETGDPIDQLVNQYISGLNVGG